MSYQHLELIFFGYLSSLPFTTHPRAADNRMVHKKYKITLCAMVRNVTECKQIIQHTN